MDGNMITLWMTFYSEDSMMSSNS